MTYQTLLPQESTAWERAVEEAGATFAPLPVPLADLWNADRCPEHMLPYLAASLSVDLWREGWPVWKKRQVIREAIELARIKGTQAAMDRYLRQVDAELVHVITPPVKMYLATGMSKAELDQFYSVMPQLRIYPYRNRNRHVFGKMFMGYGLGPGRFLLPSVAYTGRRAYLYDPLTGDEKLLTTIQLEAKEEERAAIERTRIVMPGDPVNAFFIGGSKSFLGRHFGTVNARSVVYTIETSNAYIHAESHLRLSTIWPSLTPLDVRFERGTDRWTTAGGKAFLGRGLGRYLVPSEAWRHAFSIVRLYDPVRTPIFHRGTRCFLGRRLGVAPFTAHVRVRLRQPYRQRTCFLGRHVARVYLRPIDTRRRDDALEAIHVSKALHDKILVSFQLSRTRRLGDRVRLGTRSRLSTEIPKEHYA